MQMNKNHNTWSAQIDGVKMRGCKINNICFFLNKKRKRLAHCSALALCRPRNRVHNGNEHFMCVLPSEVHRQIAGLPSIVRS